jgi:hypothetical protein
MATGFDSSIPHSTTATACVCASVAILTLVITRAVQDRASVYLNVASALSAMLRVQRWLVVLNKLLNIVVGFCEGSWTTGVTATRCRRHIAFFRLGETFKTHPVVLNARCSIAESHKPK